MIEAAGPDAEEVADRGARLALGIHARLTRFDPGSELSRLNRDSRPRVPASELLLLLASAVGEAGELSGGLVDATCLGAVETAGYRISLGADHTPAPAGPQAGAFRAAGPNPLSRWRQVGIDARQRSVVRPPGVRIDSGGLAKGLAADLIAGLLEGCDWFAVDCCGDIRVGGIGSEARRTLVAAPPPVGGSVAEVEVIDAVATSGIGKRSWLTSSGKVSHHLIDPSTGLPAFTGVVQATCLAPTALEAEIRAKAALLSGPEGARGWLPGGGVVVLAGGEVVLVEASGRDAVGVGA